MIPTAPTFLIRYDMGRFQTYPVFSIRGCRGGSRTAPTRAASLRLGRSSAET